MVLLLFEWVTKPTYSLWEVYCLRNAEFQKLKMFTLSRSNSVFSNHVLFNNNNLDGQGLQIDGIVA